MPAYRERVYICPGKDGLPCRILEFPLWWDRAEFFRKYGSRQMDTGNPFYVDYGMLLTGWEALAFDDRCRGLFAQDLRSRQPSVIEAMDQMGSLLKGASWVVVESYEWESGLS